MPLTVAAKVDNPAAQQDHQAVEEVEGKGGWRVDGGTDGHPSPHQTLDHQHHLQAKVQVSSCLIVLASRSVFLR